MHAGVPRSGGDTAQWRSLNESIIADIGGFNKLPCVLLLNLLYVSDILIEIMPFEVRSTTNILRL